MVVASEGKSLSPAQAEFNKLMKKLESVRKRHQEEHRRLDQLLSICTLKLLPLVEAVHRLNFQMINLGQAALAEIKLTARRQKLFEDLLRHKIDRHEHMIAVLRSGGERRRQMINRWADDHARALKESEVPF